MSELEKFINTHRLDKPVRHFMKKADERKLKFVFNAYNIEYAYIPYMEHCPDDPRNKNFPQNTDKFACIIEAPFTKDNLYKIIELSRSDKKTNDEKVAHTKMLIDNG